MVSVAFWVVVVLALGVGGIAQVVVPVPVVVRLLVVVVVLQLLLICAWEKLAVLVSAAAMSVEGRILGRRQDLPRPGGGIR